MIPLNQNQLYHPDTLFSIRKDELISMKLPNGYGNVSKLSGNRRNPWRVRKTIGFEYYDRLSKKTVDESGKEFVQLSMEVLPDGKKRLILKQKFATIGYYPTRTEALNALAKYNDDPYDLHMDTITFAEVYDKWSEEHFEKIVPSARRTWKSAYSYCEQLYSMPFKNIRTYHLEQTIKEATVGDNTKGRMKSLFNLMFKWAIKHEITTTDYASLCDSIKKPKPQIVRIPFSDEEIQCLWDNIQFPFVDMVLIGIYTGFRPQELAILKIADIDWTEKTIKGGLKTDAGRNRLVPIHPTIEDLVKQNYDKAVEMGSDTLFNDENGQQGTFLTYDKYRGRFKKVMKKCKMEHKPHDTRHTFITLGKHANMDEYILKLIVGHEVNDITEKVYTHRTIDDMRKEILKIQ